MLFIVCIFSNEHNDIYRVSLTMLTARLTCESTLCSELDSSPCPNKLKLI